MPAKKPCACPSWAQLAPLLWLLDERNRKKTVGFQLFETTSKISV